MKITITPIAVATIAPAALAAVAASVLPFAQAAPALASTPVAHHVAASPAHAASHSARTHLDVHSRPARHHRHHARHHQAEASQPTEAQAQDTQAQQTQAAAAQSQPSQVSASQPTAGESAFEQCVAWRESSNTPTDPDGLFGILPSTWQQLGYSGTAGQYSVAVQQQAFNKLYAEQGTAPWAQFDGC
jgi:hypothetical protein